MIIDVKSDNLVGIVFIEFLYYKVEEGNGNPLQYCSLEIPLSEEPGGLQSTGSHRVGHDWSNLAQLHMHGTLLKISAVRFAVVYFSALGRSFQFSIYSLAVEAFPVLFEMLIFLLGIFCFVVH